MEFSEYYQRIAEIVFPEGEAENLVCAHKAAVKDALIDLQTKVPCLRTDHADYIGQSSTAFHCGASTFDTVDGNIEAVYTLLIEGGCQRVDYRYISWQEMLGLIKQYRCCVAVDAYGMTPVAVDASGLGPPEYSAGSADQDKGYRASAPDTYWTVHRGSIYVFPAIESSEQIVVEWTGIRRTWDDATSMPLTMVDGAGCDARLNRDVAVAVEYYLDAEVHRRETKDLSSYQVSSQLYLEAVAMLIHECRKKRTHIRHTGLMALDAC